MLFAQEVDCGAALATESPNRDPLCVEIIHTHRAWPCRRVGPGGDASAQTARDSPPDGFAAATGIPRPAVVQPGHPATRDDPRDETSPARFRRSHRHIRTVCTLAGRTVRQ